MVRRIPLVLPVAIVMAALGPGLRDDLSLPSYKRALGFEATRDAWRRINRPPLPRRACCLTYPFCPCSLLRYLEQLGHQQFYERYESIHRDIELKMKRRLVALALIRVLKECFTTRAWPKKSLNCTQRCTVRISTRRLGGENY